MAKLKESLGRRGGGADSSSRPRCSLGGVTGFRRARVSRGRASSKNSPTHGDPHAGIKGRTASVPTGCGKYTQCRQSGQAWDVLRVDASYYTIVESH